MKVFEVEFRAPTEQIKSHYYGTETQAATETILVINNQLKIQKKAHHILSEPRVTSSAG